MTIILKKEKTTFIRDLLAGVAYSRPVNDTPTTLSELLYRYPHISAGGSWRPTDCTGPRTAVIIPYRDRSSHLLVLLNNIIPFLQRQQLNFRIFLVEQVGGC